MKKLIASLGLALGIFVDSHAQTTLSEISQRQARLQRIGTWTLAGWSATHLAVSGIAIGRSQGSTKYFHEMNLYWNAVNAGIAGMGLLALRKKPPEATISSAIRNHYTLQKSLLFNTGLDVAYVTSGLWLLDKSNTEVNVKRRDRFRGFGQAVIVQGGFLLLFDVTNYFVHRSAGPRLHRLLDKVTFEGAGISIKF